MFKKLGLVKRPGKGELSSEVDAKLSREPKVRHCLIEKCYKNDHWQVANYEFILRFKELEK